MTATTLDPIPAYFFPFEMPVSSSSFAHLCVLCAAGGLFFTAWFFSLFVMTHRSSHCVLNILKELLVALMTSLFVGLSLFFLCLMVGICV